MTTTTLAHEIEADYRNEHGQQVMVMWCPQVGRSVIAEQRGSWQHFCTCGARA
jgi:hypothetical protein